jgi:hypothetical protein
MVTDLFSFIPIAHRTSFNRHIRCAPDAMRRFPIFPKCDCLSNARVLMQVNLWGFYWHLIKFACSPIKIRHSIAGDILQAFTNALSWLYGIWQFHWFSQGWCNSRCSWYVYYHKWICLAVCSLGRYTYQRGLLRCSFTKPGNARATYSGTSNGTDSPRFCRFYTYLLSLR